MTDMTADGFGRNNGRLAEAQGGRVWAVPRPGGGAEVGFSLPLEPDPEA